jgi:hypothetical protein
MEQWREIAEFPDYKVSSLGRVKRVSPDSHGRIISGLLSPFVGNHGYCVVTLHRSGVQVTRLVHRLVCIAFRGPPPPKSHAAHRDGDKTNNCRSNVRWKTPSENNMEKHRHGTMRTGDNHHARYMPECMPRGSSHGNAKLKEKDIPKIRADKRSQGVIAIDYGVTQSLISNIQRGKGWAHIKG